MAVSARCSLPPPSSQRRNPASTRSRCPAAILLRVASPTARRPSGVFGPVLRPPWHRHLPFSSACARQGCPVLRAYAPHSFFNFTFNLRGEYLGVGSGLGTGWLIKVTATLFTSVPQSVIDQMRFQPFKQGREDVPTPRSSCLCRDQPCSGSSRNRGPA